MLPCLGVIFVAVQREIIIHSILTFPGNLSTLHFICGLPVRMFRIAVKVLKTLWNRWLALQKTSLQDTTRVFMDNNKPRKAAHSISIKCRHTLPLSEAYCSKHSQACLL